jgi:hypothetical protein
MPLVCAACTRTNPPEARYCYYDGTPLAARAAAGGPVAVGAQPFSHPFVFPSGQTCRTFDEFALACFASWPESREMLRQGYLERFLAGLGRTDLALAARQAGRQPDLDRGLDELLAKLPGTLRTPPRLVIQPAEVNLGQLRRGTDRRFVLHLANEGMGLVHGSIACEETDWLALGDGPGSPRKLIQFPHSLDLTVQVLGQRLKTGRQGHEGRLAVETNGGTAVVLVRVEVPIQPFAGGVLSGATTPRQIAEKAKAAPREAAPLFEQGAVAAWYEANGWIYPVRGPAASGLGAVQQFFEALGLVTPPVVEISTESVNLQGPPGATLEYVLLVQTREKRYVFAHAVSQAPWLQVGQPVLSGGTARVPLTVPAVPALPGERLAGQVQVTANGNQRFTVKVVLTVLGTSSGRPSRVAPAPGPVLDLREVLAAPPVPALVDQVEPAVQPSDQDVFNVIPVAKPPSLPVVSVTNAGPSRRRRWVHAVPLAVVFLCLLLTVVRDLLSRSGTEGEVEVAPPELIDPNPKIALQFHDTPEDLFLGAAGMKQPEGDKNAVRVLWDPSMRFGLVAVANKQGDRADETKRLTREEKGFTNNTCVRLDNKEWLFGDSQMRFPNGSLVVRNTPQPPCQGSWKARDVPLDKAPSGRAREGRKSVWIYDREKVQVTQTVEIVPGAQSAMLDTCLVRYDLENQDSISHTVGLRFLLDTFIGSNDGVPFLFPDARQLCTDQMDFGRPEDVPSFIQACENEDLDKPGTVAFLQLKVPGLEAPGRVTIGAWPNHELALRGPREHRFKEMFTLWEVPVRPIRSLDPADSAVTIYWEERQLEPGARRSVGFTYGLGVMAGSEGGGQLAVTVGGSFQPEGEFTVTALVKDPVLKQTVTLTLPQGFRLLDGDATRTVPPPPADARGTSPVTWKVQGPSREGMYILKVQSSTGASQTQPVRIRVPKIFGGN